MQKRLCNMIHLLFLAIVFESGIAGRPTLILPNEVALDMNATYSNSPQYGAAGFWINRGETVQITCNRSTTFSEILYPNCCHSYQLLLHEGRPINYNQPRITYTDEDDLVVTTIYNVSIEDEGEYRCGPQHKSLIIRDEDIAVIDVNQSYCYSNRLKDMNCYFTTSKSTATTPLSYTISFSIYSSSDLSSNGHYPQCGQHQCKDMNCRNLKRDFTDGQLTFSCEDIAYGIQNYTYYFVFKSLSPLVNTTSTYNASLVYKTTRLPCILANFMRTSTTLTVTFGLEQSEVYHSEEILKQEHKEPTSIGTAVAAEGVKYNISIWFNDGDQIIKMDRTQTSKDLDLLNMSITLPQILPITTYTASLTCQPANGVHEHTWSDLVYSYFTTDQAKPQVAPQVSGAGFSIVRTIAENTTLRLYWQQVLPIAKQGNGLITGYIVRVDSPDSIYTMVQELQADIEVSSNDRHIIYVTASNAVGEGNVSAQVTVPSQLGNELALVSDCDFTVETNGASDVIVTWTPNSYNTTLYACEQLEGRCLPSEELNITSMLPGTSSYTLTSKRVWTSSQFGLSHDDGLMTSGIVWARCIYTQNATELELPKISVRPGQARMAYITLISDCKAGTGRADYYILKWCREKSTCQYPSQLRVERCDLRNKFETEVQLDDYGTKYDIWVTSYSGSGSGPSSGKPDPIQSSRRELQGEEIALIVIGAVLFAALVIVTSICCYRQRLKVKFLRAPVVMTATALGEMRPYSSEREDDFDVELTPDDYTAPKSFQYEAFGERVEANAAPQERKSSSPDSECHLLIDLDKSTSTPTPIDQPCDRNPMEELFTDSRFDTELYVQCAEVMDRNNSNPASDLPEPSLDYAPVPIPSCTPLNDPESGSECSDFGWQEDSGHPHVDLEPSLKRDALQVDIDTSAESTVISHDPTSSSLCQPPPYTPADEFDYVLAPVVETRPTQPDIGSADDDDDFDETGDYFRMAIDE